MKKFLRKTKVVSRLLIILIVITSIVFGKPVTETEASTEIHIETSEEETSKEETTEELSPEEPEIPLEPSMPGRIEGTGTYFEIKDSEYLNIILKSTKEIKVVLESMPRMISLDIETALEEISSAVLTLEDLEPNKTYYKYQESYKNDAVFVSDEKGNYSWSQDLTQPHHIWIQEIRGTILIPDQCSDCGIWDEETSTCTLTQDLTESVEIIADNITLDGNGHSIKGEGTSGGIYSYEKKNVTIKNCVISNFYYGVILYSYFAAHRSCYNILDNNTLKSNNYGIYLSHSANNKLLNNRISNNNLNGIRLRASGNNTINGNTVDSSKCGINLGKGFDPHANPIPSKNNIIINNTINSNQWSGIYLSDSSNNTITNNAILNNGYGIRLDASSDNNLAENIVSLNNEGISFLHSTDNTLTSNKINSNKGSGIFFSHSSSNNILRNNTISENQYNLGFYWNDAPEDFIQDIDISNTINGKPIYYLVNEENKEISGEAGFIGLVNSLGITVKNLTLNNNWYGVLLVSTENSKIENIHASNNHHGIYLLNSLNNNFINNNVSNNESALHLRSSSNNIFNGNTVRSNNSCAIYLSYASDNIFYHNNFIDNLLTYPSCFLSQVHNSTPQIRNIYDNGYPVGGNYWSDYTGVDEKNGFNQDQAGSDGIGDSPYGIYYYHYLTSTTERINQDNYPFMVESGWEVKPDFSISFIKPVQVIWDSKIDDNDTIDLVAGKSTTVRVYVGMENYEGLPKDLPVDVQLIAPEFVNDFIHSRIYTASTTIEQLEKNNKQVDFYLTNPIPIGDHIVIAEVYPKNEIEEADNTNNEDSIEVTVKDTNGLYLVYFPVERPESYGPLKKYQTTVENSNEFTKAVYPIPESEFIGEPKNEVVKGKKKIPWRAFGIRIDTVEVLVRAKILGADIGIGIVPDDYFAYHGEDAFGMTFGWKGALVEEGTRATIAHEIGHMYGLDDEDPLINIPSGFWVTKHQPIEDPLYRCFMTGTELWPWVCNECYTHLFKEFRAGKTDPVILLVDGVIYKDGAIELGEWYKVEEGKDDLEEIVPGDYSLQILDESGNILQEVSFSPKFQVFAAPLGIIETDFAPFTFAIPYPENASFTKILYKNETVTEVDLIPKLLNDTMDRLIPDYETLIESIERTDIQKGIKNSLTSKLNNAKMKVKQGLMYIKDNHNIQGKNMLNSASNIVEAFINEVSAQKKETISKRDAEGFIVWAHKMILRPQYQIIENL